MGVATISIDVTNTAMMTTLLNSQLEYEIQGKVEKKISLCRELWKLIGYS